MSRKKSGTYQSIFIISEGDDTNTIGNVFVMFRQIHAEAHPSKLHLNSYSMYTMDVCVSERLYWYVLTVHCVCGVQGDLSVKVISLYVGSYLCFPLVSIVEELLLVVEQLLMGFSGELKVRTLKEKRDRWRVKLKKYDRNDIILKKHSKPSTKQFPQTAAPFILPFTLNREAWITNSLIRILLLQ